MSVLIIGAAGAIGRRLATVLSARGDAIIASDRASKLPENLIATSAATEPNVDVRDMSSVRALFQKHPKVETVWNLAAPLSVETALSPTVAEDVTVGGMKNILQAMSEVGARKICFTDSIGSFGALAPRENCTARWLSENPTQDPGSDYGKQKRGCRDLMAKFQQDHNGDPRFAVLPGVLHTEPRWGSGTTEYALEALRAASMGKQFVCTIMPDVRLPMIFVDDLVRGMMALQDGVEQNLNEPYSGYCIPGLSFTAYELFSEIKKHHPRFTYRVELDQNMNNFAKLWPDTLSEVEADRDLNYRAKVELPEMVERVLAAHEKRNRRQKLTFLPTHEHTEAVHVRPELC